MASSAKADPLPTRRAWTLRRASAGARAKPERTPWRKGWKSDLLLGATGVALGLTCAFFPWYIFFHQEQFGIRAMKFEGVDATAAGSGATPTFATTPPMSVSEVPLLELDLFSTGAVPDAAGGDSAASLEPQPFPVVAPPFRVVHAANGRAMIEDDTGIWVVQRGSVLPDDSRVTAIEKRDGKWIVVTDGERVLELAN